MHPTKEDIFAGSNELLCSEVPVPEWTAKRDASATVFVRELVGDDADKAMEILSRRDENELGAREMWVGMCILCVCDENRVPLFDMADKELLLSRPLAPLQRCAVAAMELNGFGENAHEARVGNSESDHT